MIDTTPTELAALADRLSNLSRIMAGGDGTRRIDTTAWQHAEQLATELRALASRDGGGCPEGWVCVPVEPTENMVVDGFESEPDAFFSTPEEWDAYEALSGCQRAAHRARLCWAAMLKAAQLAGAVGTKETR